jgi:cytochrome c biogenesis protein CcmG/thiol:disulfide interchange protein DsbE
VGALALLTLFAGCASDEGESGTTPAFAEPDEPAPDFTLPTLEEETVRLADLSGRPVVVNFWASWCNPCRQEFPLLAEALVEHEDDDLAVVGITFKDIESDSRAFAREVGATWPLAVDDNGGVAAAYGVRAIPQTFFVDRGGIIRARVFGFSSEEALEEPLRTILR